MINGVMLAKLIVVLVHNLKKLIRLQCSPEALPRLPWVNSLLHVGQAQRVRYGTEGTNLPHGMNECLNSELSYFIESSNRSNVQFIRMSSVECNHVSELYQAMK